MNQIFNRRYGALLLGGLLIGCLGSPAAAAENAPRAIDQSSFVPLGGLDRAFMTEPTAFLDALVKEVRPVAIEFGSRTEQRW